MTVVVIDMFEVVEIDKCQREMVATFVTADTRFHTLLDGDPVGQSSKLIELSAFRRTPCDLIEVKVSFVPLHYKTPRIHETGEAHTRGGEVTDHLLRLSCQLVQTTAEVKRSILRFVGYRISR